MPKPADQPPREPGWVIDLSTPSSVTIGDARLAPAAAALIAIQRQLETIVTTTAAIEEIIRDAKTRGVTRDTLATELSLSIEAVDRVLAGGTIFQLPR